jgi:RNA ligase
MMSPEAYFKEHDLWDMEKLLQHAEHNFVWVIRSQRYPNLIMLHYKDEAQWEGKWSTFARMSRGLIVDMKNQKVLAYPFDKFFNMGQEPEVSYENLLQAGKFTTSEKLDGSMLILFQDPETGKLHFTTKGSFDSEHGSYAEQYLPADVPPGLDEFTYVFELIAKRFQIVIDYKKKNYPEGIYLIGIRHRRSNKMLSHEDVQLIANKWGLPTFKMYEFGSLDSLIEQSKTLNVLEEGYVLHYPDQNLFVKVKGPEYLRAHRFISKLSDRYLLEMLGMGEEKTILEIAPEEYRQDIEDKVTLYKRKYLDMTNDCYQKFADAPKDTRKNFALWVKGNVDPNYQGFMFNLMDSKPIDKRKAYELIAKIENVSAETRV